MSAVLFDAAEHAYTVDGLALPSVTEILKATGRWWTPRQERARRLGKAVHAATLAADEGGPVPPSMAAYVHAYRRFLYLLAAVPERREVPQARVDLGYAGTPDWEGTVRGVPSVVDLKTGSRADWHRLQTAAYDLLDPSRNGRQRMCVYLGADGRFHVDPHPRRGDYAEWLGIVAEHGGRRDGEASDESDW